MPEISEPNYTVIKTNKEKEEINKKKYKFLDDIIDNNFITKYFQTIKIK